MCKYEIVVALYYVLCKFPKCVMSIATFVLSVAHEGVL